MLATIVHIQEVYFHNWALEAIIRSVESRVAIPHWKVYLQVYMAVGLLAGPFLMLLQDLEDLNV